jgi:hypothetical protein
MIIVLYPDDLRYNYEGNKKKPDIKDFPALESTFFDTGDVVLYNYNNKQIILKGPIDENNAVLKVRKRTSRDSSRKLTIRHEDSKLLHQGSGYSGPTFQLGTYGDHSVGG